MSSDISDVEKAISFIEKMKKDFEAEDIPSDEEYRKYCLRYFDDAIFDLKGVLYYLQKEE